jgi:hypothetical protein
VSRLPCAPVIDANKHHTFGDSTGRVLTSSFGDRHVDWMHSTLSLHVRPDDRYVYGSITKMFTGPAVLQLVDEGLISLDDPIAMHVDPILRALNSTSLGLSQCVNPTCCCVC